MGIDEEDPVCARYVGDEGVGECMPGRGCWIEVSVVDSSRPVTDRYSPPMMIMFCRSDILWKSVA